MFTEQFQLTGASGTHTRRGQVRVVRYDSGAATGGASPLIRIRSDSGSKFDVEMLPGRTVNLAEPVQGIVVTNISAGANVSGKLTFGDGSVSDDAVVGSVALDTGTIAALIAAKYNVRPEAHTGFFSDSSAIVANTPLTAFTPGSNVNGAILLQARIYCGDDVTINPTAVFLAKASAPANTEDGANYCHAQFQNLTNGKAVAVGQVDTPQFIPAGLGLYYICNSAQKVTLNARYARYILL